MQNDTSKFVRNIVALQNVNSNVSGTNAITVLSNSIIALQEMVNPVSKSIRTDSLQSFNNTSIAVLSGLNLCNVGITSNGTLYGNTSRFDISTVTTSTLKADSGTFSGICYAQQFVTLSDMLAKTDAREWRSPVFADLQKIHPYIFSYTNSKTEDIGLMAKEVGAIWPNLVKEGVKGDYVNYDGVVALLLKAVQELGARVSTLEGR